MFKRLIVLGLIVVMGATSGLAFMTNKCFATDWSGYVGRWHHYRAEGKQHSDCYDNMLIHSTAVGYREYGKDYVTNRSGLVLPEKTSYASYQCKPSGNRAWYNRYK